jgi:hypothetical protein
VIGASALVSATAIAGRPYFNPQFHFQERYNQDSLYAYGCEDSSDGYACWDLSSEGTLFGDTPVQFVRVNETVLAGSVYTFRSLVCLVPADTIEVAPAARAARFEALIDIAKDGCETDGYSVDYSTGEYGPPPEFPNSVSIRVLLSDPFATNSSTSTGNASTKEGARDNYHCNLDSAYGYEDASAEFNGSSKFVAGSDGHRNRCSRVSKP